MGRAMLCTLAVEASWLVFPQTIGLKAGASHKKAGLGLLSPNLAVAFTLSWTGCAWMSSV